MEQIDRFLTLPTFEERIALLPQSRFPASPEKDTPIGKIRVPVTRDGWRRKVSVPVVPNGLFEDRETTIGSHLSAVGLPFSDESCAPASPKDAFQAARLASLSDDICAQQLSRIGMRAKNYFLSHQGSVDLCELTRWLNKKRYRGEFLSQVEVHEACLLQPYFVVSYSDEMSAPQIRLLKK